MNQTNPKPFIFVLMPFHSDFDDTYQLGIKAACELAGAYCERVDEQNFDETILERVYNQISKADVIVSDMSGKNPNVFYETGYAHALNKRVILLTRNADDIPFDLKSYTHIIYDGKIVKLRSELEKTIKWSIENPTKSLSRASVNLEYHIGGIVIKDGMEIAPQPRDFYEISVHNTSGRFINSDTFSLAIIKPQNLDFELAGNEDYSEILLPDKRVMIYPPNKNSLFPDDWFAIRFQLLYMKNDKDPAKITLRLSTEIGSQDVSFIALIRSFENKPEIVDPEK